MAGLIESLEEEELDHRRDRHWYDRLIMLCDGVFAISITFLAVEVRAPDAWSGDWAGLMRPLAQQLDAYAMSFLVISIYWLAHRRMMAMILKVDAPVTVISLIVLGLVALLPAATRLLSGHSTYPPSRLIYAGLVVAIGGAIGVLWGYAALIAKVVSVQVSLAERWFYLFLMLWTPSFFLLLTMALPNPAPGETALILAGLFLVGWRLRLWVAARLAKAAKREAACAPPTPDPHA
jgi:uncharacterized membrane protein